MPDVARVYLGVTFTKPTVKEARNAAAAAMTDVIAAIKGLGIADADIQTTGLSLSARYAENSSTKIVGYIISEQIQVTVRDLDKAGDVVDAATAKGATDVNGISFELADPAKAQNDARAAAVTAARDSAQAMASAAHVTLGAVVSISDASAPTPIYYGAASGAAPMADVKTPVQPGHPGRLGDRDGRLRDRLTVHRSRRRRARRLPAGGERPPAGPARARR